MTNQALLYAQMQGNGMGGLLPSPDEYERDAEAKREKGEKWASRVAGILFGGAMLAWGTSNVTFTDANGNTIPPSAVPVGQMVQAVLAQNSQIQFSQISRETIKPLFEDVCGWIAGLFYPSKQEARMMGKMLAGQRGAQQAPHPGYAQAPHPAAGQNTVLAAGVSNSPSPGPGYVQLHNGQWVIPGASGSLGNNMAILIGPDDAHIYWTADRIHFYQVSGQAWHRLGAPGYQRAPLPPGASIGAMITA